MSDKVAHVNPVCEPAPEDKRKAQLQARAEKAAKEKRNAKLRERLVNVEARIKVWESKEKRARTALDKLRASAKRYAKQLA